MTVSNAERQRRWRAAHPGADKRKGDRHAIRNGIRGRSVRPFVGCDGEGCGADELGRQLYTLFRMGDRELYAGGQHLNTAELLDFICDEPAGSILVGFSFGYDVTMILRDLSSERRERLLAPAVFGAGKSRYVYYKNFGIEYLKRNYFRVCRTVKMPDGRRRIIKGSTRTIWEVFGFFQCSFLKALKNFGIGSQYADLIERNKAARPDFRSMTAEIREYCAAECAMLAELMTEFRACCTAVDIIPSSWSGAGKLAAALHKQHGTITRAELADLLPEGVRKLAHAAYYGGRFEISRVGEIAGPIHEYDINSAYPAAMERLPCLVHGTWRELSAKQCGQCGPDDLFVADLRFKHPASRFYGLPIRDAKGHVYWPAEGNGVYWSTEIRSAEAMGCRMHYRAGWLYQRNCDCKPFAWVRELYDYRKSIGKATKGYPIKLGINSLYGKLAQRVGNPVWGNFVWAGLITADCRSRLNSAIVRAPDDIVMIATDGIYSKVALDLDTGSSLGQWEHNEHPRLFIVQPGLYWGAARPKTRGVPLTMFQNRLAEFERGWAAYAASDKAGGDSELPVVEIRYNTFTGLRLAQSRGKPETAGVWVNQARAIRYDWTKKRQRSHVWENNAVLTSPLPGGRNLHTMLYADVPPEVISRWDADIDTDEQPDYVDLTSNARG